LFEDDSTALQTRGTSFQPHTQFHRTKGEIPSFSKSKQ